MQCSELASVFLDGNTWRRKSSVRFRYCCDHPKFRSRENNYKIQIGFVIRSFFPDPKPIQSLTMALTALMTDSAVAASSLIFLVDMVWRPRISKIYLWRSTTYGLTSNLQILWVSWLTPWKKWISSGIQTPSASLLTWSQIKSVALSTGSAWGRWSFGKWLIQNVDD